MEKQTVSAENAHTQTAVEWFVNSVFGKNGLILYAEIIEQAKAMEKEHTIRAYIDGYIGGERYDETPAEEYYNKTFNK
jgi:HEPN domain-containing protein